MREMPSQMSRHRIIRWATVLTGVFYLWLPLRAWAIHPYTDISIFNAYVDAAVTFDPAQGLYSYQYTLTNPMKNTGRISYFMMDISVRDWEVISLPSTGLHLDWGVDESTGTRDFITFDEAVDFISVGRHTVVPVGTLMPQPGLGSDLTVDRKVSWGLDPYLEPGSSLGPFQVMSPGLPAIRSFQITPDFFPIGLETESSEGDLRGKASLSGETIGPIAPPSDLHPFSFIQRVQQYVAESQRLGWLTSKELASKLTDSLSTATLALEKKDMAAVKQALQDFIKALPEPTSDCNPQCFGGCQVFS